MYVQTEITPNPNSLKFIPGKKVSIDKSFEITNKEDIDNSLLRNILSINGVKTIFLGGDFLSVNKEENVDWEDITQDETHIYIADFGNNNGNRTDLKIYKILKQ